MTEKLLCQRTTYDLELSIKGLLVSTDWEEFMRC